ncbi:MAG: hypothetical protein MJ092_03490 [Lachnospiraceae bacterium]|nr:hypothetical protein [Lachnospiraceae bacterium]
MFNIENYTYLLNNLIAEKAKLQEAINDAPDASLTCKTRKNGKQELYIRWHAGSPQFSSKSIYVNQSLVPLARQIAEGMYARAKIGKVNKVIKGLSYLIDVYGNTAPEDLLLQKRPWLYSMMPNALDNNEKMRKWKLAEYERTFEHPENIIHETCVPGLLVRSKSEADIVSRLEHFGVPYHYDEFQTFNGVRLSIDFICINVQTGKKWCWDHRGMLDNPSYIEKTLFRERIFLNAGIIHGINLIITSETSAHPLSIPTIDEEIRRYLL